MKLLNHSNFNGIVEVRMDLLSIQTLWNLLQVNDTVIQIRVSLPESIVCKIFQSFVYQLLCINKSYFPSVYKHSRLDRCRPNKYYHVILSLFCGNYPGYIFGYTFRVQYISCTYFEINHTIQMRSPHGIFFCAKWLCIGVGKKAATLQTTLSLISPGQNGRHFADDIFRCIFVNKTFIFWLKFHWSLFLKV